MQGLEVTYAHACGLRYEGRGHHRQGFQKRAGHCADIETLRKLYELKLPMTEHVVAGAIRSKDLPKVIWLCEELRASCLQAVQELQQQLGVLSC